MAKGKKVMKLRAQAKKFTFKFDGKVEKVSTPGGKYYPGDDVVLKKGPTPVRNPTKLRSSITPGTVLILLAGRFRGKRVVFLKQLSSGLLLVSGPYGLNGVPLRRVNQKYVIATNTKVDLGGVDVSKIDDALFAREDSERSKEDMETLFAGGEAIPTYTSAARKAAQTAVDSALTKNIDKVEMLGAYMKAKFSLSKGDKPHLMKF
jgi:large subunit ribosomal protein L6e